METPFSRQPRESRTFRYPWTQCPHCGDLWDAATAPDQFGSRGAVGPKDGSFALCVACAEPSKFVVAMGVLTMQPLSPEELAEFMSYHGEYVEQMRRMDRQQRKRRLL